MRTERLYYADSHLTEFDALVRESFGHLLERLEVA